MPESSPSYANLFNGCHSSKTGCVTASRKSEYKTPDSLSYVDPAFGAHAE